MEYQFYEELLIRLAERQNNRCVYCRFPVYHPKDRAVDYRGHNRMTLEHVIPISRGGCDCEANLIVACKLCNNLRGNLSARLFARFIQHHLKGEPVWKWHRIKSFETARERDERKELRSRITSKLHRFPRIPEAL